MAKIPESLQIALESDCAEDLNEIIRAHRKTDFDRLRELLSTSPDVDPRYRIRAIYALGRWGDDSVVDDIVQLMPVLDELGQASALDSLGRLGSARSLQAILKHSDDPSPHVRKFAIHALGRFNMPEARAKLVEIRDKDPDQNLRDLASRYLEADR